MSGKYRIIIKERLDPNWANWFGKITVDYDEQGNTMLDVTIPDQPALHGVLDRIRDLNLTLISITQIKSDSDNPSKGEKK